MMSRLFGSSISVLPLPMGKEIGYLHSPWLALPILPSGCSAMSYDPRIVLARLRVGTLMSRIQRRGITCAAMNINHRYAEGANLMHNPG
jgi:hypothetical protein